MSVVARLLGEREHRLPGLRVVDRELAVPLDHARPEVGEPLQLFAREVVAASKAREDLPVLVYLQGGPGGKCPRPARRDSWLERACQDYRVLLLDQRGTGQSSPATAQTVTALGPPAAQAEYLSHFRADAIVEDAEAVRRALLGPATRWSLLGQSFGGFCVLRYLSAAPEGVREAFITGGVPSLDATATDIYRASYPRVANKNAAYFARYPEDRARLAEVITSIGDGAGLPGGGRLSVRRLLCLGLAFGMSDGFEAVHYLLAEAFVRVGGRHQLADGFLHAAAARLSRVQDPLFAVLHEAIYCQGRSSGWAAEAVRAELPEFAVDAADLHRRDDLPLVVRGGPGPRAARRGRRPPRFPRGLAGAVRHRHAGWQRRPGGGRRLRG